GRDAAFRVRALDLPSARNIRPRGAFWRCMSELQNSPGGPAPGFHGPPHLEVADRIGHRHRSAAAQARGLVFVFLSKFKIFFVNPLGSAATHEMLAGA
ncbi:MAG TPA: hypothetical protein VM534_10565, partial [Thermoanaerobaculia bacterium]|nr:hypothetical protein [Thermoanaerobaculia bacterium]